MKISTLLDQIDNGQAALPEFQRGYVWNRDQVRGLMASLYKRYPVGSLLSWTTDSGSVGHRGGHTLNQGAVNLLLDGQQRITSLYGIIRGRPPVFFDGDERAFKDLYFNVDTEEFSFYMSSKMASDPLWISVTDLMIEGPETVAERLAETMELSFKEGSRYTNRLNRLRDVRDIEVHVEQISGADKTLDVVVEIFNRVNSGGTKLSKGDLALARICSTQPDAREKMREALDQWSESGFSFSLDWLLRSVTTLTRSDARFSSIHDLTGQEFNEGLGKAIKHINYLLDLIGARLGLDHQQVLTGHYTFPVLVRYIEEQGGKISDEKTVNALLFWYIHAAIWGRYSSSTESVLGRDLDIILENPSRGLDALIRELFLWRGSLKVRADNFAGSTRGNRFYSLLYMLTRVEEARDWGLGIPLKKGMLGANASLELHHIFPKHRLREYGYDNKQVNALANFCFLTKGSNLSISNRYPTQYFPEVEESHPGALESQWVPLARELWKIEHYPEFLRTRRERLAEATNKLLEGLYWFEEESDVGTEPVAGADVPGGIQSEEDEKLLKDLQSWMQSHQLPPGEMERELVAPESGEVRAFLELAWPEGFQPGLDEPAMLMLADDPEVELAATHAGYRVFRNPVKLKRHVALSILDDPYAFLPDWAQNVSEQAVGLVDSIIDHGLPAPVVGYEVQTSSGEVVGEFELAWPDRKIGVWATGGRANPLPDTLVGWHLFTLAELQEAPGLVLNELCRYKVA